MPMVSFWANATIGKRIMIVKIIFFKVSDLGFDFLIEVLFSRK
jgi:uncharacterized RDD family membrane protein YckC